MPALNPHKTYVPQGEWIRSQIGSEESFGLAYPPRGHHKMGGFKLHTDAHVELLNSREELERYLSEHPASIVLLHDQHIEDYYPAGDDTWQSRVIHELTVGRDRYLVLQ